MNLFEKFFYALDSITMTRPTNYGWFHLMFVAIVIGLTTFLCIKFKDADDKTVRRIVMIMWIVMATLEVYKQITFAISDEDGVLAWDYAWYAFPYQLCSTPLYILPFIAWLKDCRVRDCMISYIATFSLFGGLAVFCYPNDVFIGATLINFQTMIHHGIQVVLGIFFLVRARRSLTFKRFSCAVPVFAVMVSIAILLNLSVYAIFQANGVTDDFNMFYISPYFDCTLPVLSAIYPNVPYVVFALLYILGFCVVSAIVFYGAKGIVILTDKIRDYVKFKKSQKVVH
ncbi:MAG: YwaF family protein [Clostridia bacterium]|nr:YwaF family protein [Clostridia bacterium]